MKSCCTDHDFLSAKTTRRSFIKLAALGGSAALFASFLPTTALASGKTEALLLSCMDYRLIDSVDRYMVKRGLQDNYDHMVLAGASLGAVTDKFPAWNKTFWDHLDIAIKLHNIHKVIVMDHRDCGAYKTILGEDFAKNAALETSTHEMHLRNLTAEIRKKHPSLAVEMLLMALDGSVEYFNA